MMGGIFGTIRRQVVVATKQHSKALTLRLAGGANQRAQLALQI